MASCWARVSESALPVGRAFGLRTVKVDSLRIGEVDGLDGKGVRGGVGEAGATGQKQRHGEPRVAAHQHFHKYTRVVAASRDGSLIRRSALFAGLQEGAPTQANRMSLK